MNRPVPVQLDDPTNPIRCEFFLVEPPPTKLGQTLVMKFAGTYRIGCQGNPDASFIGAMQAAAVAYWSPAATVLDLSELDYRWGEMMGAVLGSRLPSGLHAVVVGPGCHCTEAVVRLARTIYDERAFHRLGELADELQRAGCRDEALLTHLQSPLPHARGCHVLDLVVRGA